MAGRITVGGVLAAALLAAAAWASGWFRASAQVNAPADNGGTIASTAAPTAADKTDIGAPLHSIAPSSLPQAGAPGPQQQALLWRPVIVAPNSRTSLIDVVDVPAAREGVLAFVGTEIKPGEQVAAGDILEHKVGSVTKQYRRLKEGDWVEKNQLLALVDDRLARAEVHAKQAKLKASLADKQAALDTREETYQRYLTQKRLWDGGSGNLPVTSFEELRGAQATYLRYKSEAVSKEEAVTVAQAELNQAETTLGMYEVRCKLSGRVKKLYKHTNEAVHNLDPVVQIENYQRLRVEGFVELQHKQDMQGVREVVVEPTVRQSALRPLAGHRREVNGVAFAKDAAVPTLVSAGEDGTVRVWKLSRAQEAAIFQNNGGPVRAVACTPPGAERALPQPANLCVTGDAAGKVRLWDLDRAQDESVPLREMQGRHQRAVRCVAFSPDGRLCASGGEDHVVMVWDTVRGTLLHQLTGHRDAVTALSFYEAKGEGLHLVSVGDDAVQDWALGTHGAAQGVRHPRRSSQVSQLGVSAEGGLLMDEQGAEMHVISMATGRQHYVLSNTSRASAFKAVALFSPDGRLALTISGSQEYVQLWRLGQPRSYECRQLMTGEGGPIRCAAFDPHGRFVAAGLQERKVCVWVLPPQRELSQTIRARVNTVEGSVDTVQNQVRLIAEADNAKGQLTAGDVVTLVVYPDP
jgi:multidrug efflux pump subunit AcrA (membrane-fusion protein)